MDKNKEICRLLGIEWHEPDGDIYHPYLCTCGREVGSYDLLVHHCDNSHPDFTTDAGKVLQALEDKGLLKDFIVWITNRLHDDTGNSCIALAKMFADTTGKLRDAALEWLKERR